MGAYVLFRTRQVRLGIVCHSIRWVVIISFLLIHYSDVIMGVMASQITSLTIVYSTIYSGGGQRKHQSSASLAFVRGIPWWPGNSQHKWPVTRKISQSDDVIMQKTPFIIVRIALMPLQNLSAWFSRQIWNIMISLECLAIIAAYFVKMTPKFNGMGTILLTKYRRQSTISCVCIIAYRPRQSVGH